MDREIPRIKEEGKKWKKQIWWIGTLAVLLFLGGIFFGSRAEASNEYLKRGDELLRQKRYLSAIVEYKKAEFLDQSEAVLERIRMAREAQEDVRNLEEFYVEIGAEEELLKFREAKAVPETAYRAVFSAKSFLEAG